MKVMIRGKVYQSVDEASIALGVTKSTIYVALHRGRADTVGIGSGRGSSNIYNRGRKPIPFSFMGIKFRSMQEASRELGMSERYVQQVLSIGKTRARENLTLRLMRYVAKKNREKAEKK